MPTNQYEIPRYGSDANTILGWLLEANQEGRAWQTAQKPASRWQSAQELMDEGDDVAETSAMSNTTYPKAKRVARELVASLASFKHEGEFKVLWDNSLYDQAHLLTDLDFNWHMSAKPGAAHRGALQNGVVKGTGYWLEEWDKDFYGPGHGDIRLSWMDPADVMFVQLPRDHDLQRAYMTILRFELPINLAKRMFWKSNPGFAASLVPDQETPSWIQKGLRAVQRYISPALRVAGRTGQNNQGTFPTVDIYHGYTMDGSLNEGFDPIEMGAYKTNWSYKVPVYGGEKPTDIINPATGQLFTTPATWEDCQLFPLKRLSIWSNTGIAYDGSSPWWHGDTPVAQIKYNDWPWQALGSSLVTDIRSMGAGITALMRGMEDSAAARLDPPALFDDSVVSRSWAESFNPRLAGTRGAAPLSQGNPITFPVDPRYYDVAAWIPQFMEAQEGRMDYLTGVRDLVAMAKAKQIPGADTLEKLLEMAGPIVQDLVGALETPLTQLGEWRKAYYFQFYNSARVIRTVGPDDFSPEQWKYEPDKLQKYFNSAEGKDMLRRYTPDQANSIMQTGSYQFNPAKLFGVSGPAELRSINLRRKMTEFRYEVTESGINELNRTSMKLIFIQLMKEGFPISWWTIAKLFRIPNFGAPPEGTNTEFERWVAQQHIKIDLQVDLQKEVAGAMGQMGEGQMGPGAIGEAPSIPDLEGSSRGRPQSYAASPRIIQKDHGTRSTISTAKP